MFGELPVTGFCEVMNRTTRGRNEEHRGVGSGRNTRNRYSAGDALEARLERGVLGCPRLLLVVTTEGVDVVSVGERNARTVRVRGLLLSPTREILGNKVV